MISQTSVMGVEVPIHIHYPPYLPGRNIEVTDRMWRVSRDEINASPNNCPESSVFQQRHALYCESGASGFIGSLFSLASTKAPTKQSASLE